MKYSILLILLFFYLFSFSQITIGFKNKENQLIKQVSFINKDSKISFKYDSLGYFQLDKNLSQFKNTYFSAYIENYEPLDSISCNQILLSKNQDTLFFMLEEVEAFNLPELRITTKSKKKRYFIGKRNNRGYPSLFLNRARNFKTINEEGLLINHPKSDHELFVYDAAVHISDTSNLDKSYFKIRFYENDFNKPGKLLMEMTFSELNPGWNILSVNKWKFPKAGFFYTIIYKKKGKQQDGPLTRISKFIPFHCARLHYDDINLGKWWVSSYHPLKTSIQVGD